LQNKTTSLVIGGLHFLPVNCYDHSTEFRVNRGNHRVA